MRKEQFIMVLKKIRESIKESQFENHVFCVGGAVRDLYLNREIKDIDIAVDLPNGGIALAEYLKSKLKLKSSPTIFPNYGTAKVDLDIENIGLVQIELVQCRKEWYTEGSRKPSSIAVGTIKDDAIRRDLTINALYLNICSNKLEDPTEMAKSDMLKHLLRTTNDASTVFKDDALRMLRVIRFKAQLGWDIEKETYSGIVKNSKNIKNISKERITEELNKILLSKRPSEGLNMLRNTCLLEYVCKPLYKMRFVENNDGLYNNLYDYTLSVIDETEPKLINRLAALIHAVGKVYTLKNNRFGKLSFIDFEKKSRKYAELWLKSMKYSNSIIENVCFLIERQSKLNNFNKKLSNMSNKSFRRFVNDCGNKLYDVLDLINAINMSKGKEETNGNQVDYFLKKLEEFKKKGEDVQNMKPPINGKDIMESLKIKEGSMVGYWLKQAKNLLFDNPKITKDEMIAKLKEQKNKIVSIEK